MKREFKDRIGQKSLVYTRKLSDALKSLEINVTKKELQAEEATMRDTDESSSRVLEDITGPYSMSVSERKKFEARLNERLWQVFEKHIGADPGDT